MRKLLFLLIFPASVWGQEDTVQIIEEVDVRFVAYKIDKRRFNNYLDTKEIEALQADDVGDVIRKFSGTNIRSYGGLGGLKTVSVRSLGANHTAINMDGFTLLNSQTGQINLGQLQVANLVSVSDAYAADQIKNVPVSALVSGSTIFVQSFENFFGRPGLSVRANAAYASFNHLEGYLGARYRKNGWLASASGAVRKADGTYPFTYSNGYQTVSAFRVNNDYLDANYTATLGYAGKSSAVRIGYRGKTIEQGLPGAIVFYNQTQNERLNTDENALFSDVTWRFNRYSFRIHGQVLQNTLQYIDPDFLNASGGLDVQYTNRTLNGGVMAQVALNQWNLHAGTEQFISDLAVNNSLFAQPLRYHNMSVLVAVYHLPRFELRVQASSQYISERNGQGMSAGDRFRVNPYLELEHISKKRKFTQKISYRSTFRMPSFNELYYNSVGNVKLLPEDAHVFNYGTLLDILSGKLDIKLRTNLFANLVKNKIVAFPTQNLFVWSMQNIGQARIFGAEALVDLNWKINTNWRLDGTVNYTFQRALDYSDRNSPSYGHQLAYIPMHSGNLDLSIHFKNSGIRLSNYALSMRYVLNENIPQNEMEGFWILDAGLFHSFHLKKENKLTVRATVKNVLNQSYAYIRSYVMPGTNVTISLNYALN